MDRFDLKAGNRLELADAVGRPHCFTVLEGEGSLREGAAEARLRRSASTVVPACSGPVTLLAARDIVAVRSMA